MTAFDLTAPDAARRAALTAELSPDQRRVLLEHGTEAAFCGVFLDNKRDGVYTCGLCGLPLFRSTAKFDSGTGWPSFFQPLDPTHIRIVRDTRYGMLREEEVCARCASHLGHVFPDGPPPTGLRHCLNSVALVHRRRRGAAGQAGARRARRPAAVKPGGRWLRARRPHPSRRERCTSSGKRGGNRPKRREDRQAASVGFAFLQPISHSGPVRHRG